MKWLKYTWPQEDNWFMEPAMQAIVNFHEINWARCTNLYHIIWPEHEIFFWYYA